MPSLYEGYGMALAEAMALETKATASGFLSPETQARVRQF